MKSEVQPYFRSLLTSRANNLLEHQEVVAAMSYNSRSGELLRATQQSPAVMSSSGASLTLSYPLHIRFLDMKRGRSGCRKKVYEPVYNRFIWGFLFTGTYMALLRGLTGRISMTVARTIEGQVTDIR